MGLTTDTLLKERQETHGNFAEVAEKATHLQSYLTTNGVTTTSVEHALQMICVKLARITAGNPMCADHWRDIAGYAELAAQSITLREGSSVPQAVARRAPEEYVR